ncbi:hypothetical protein EVAR_99631_1 [Eumeta japonica]|uniref:Uncharacterized protein n=1 Tax=Eumeta variegata TaxID=151549 RepID=A0A4C2A0F8_EUMVA|nr:hypothetical protein EVAR_99631_1 [Eumeta japonica]
MSPNVLSVVVPAAFIAAEIIYEGGAVSASLLISLSASPVGACIATARPDVVCILRGTCLVAVYDFSNRSGLTCDCNFKDCHVARLNRLVVSRVIGQSNFVRTNVALWINLNTAWKRGPRVESRARSGRRRARGRVAALPALTATQCIGEASSRRREHVKFTFDRDRAPVWR